MHVKLLKELLNLDKQHKQRKIQDHKHKPLDKQLQQQNIQEEQRTIQNKNKFQHEIQDKRHKENKIQDADDISSNLMKTIVDAYEPVNLDLESIGDSDILSSASSSYDSFYN